MGFLWIRSSSIVISSNMNGNLRTGKCVNCKISSALPNRPTLLVYSHVQHVISGFGCATNFWLNLTSSAPCWKRFLERRSVGYAWSSVYVSWYCSWDPANLSFGFRRFRSGSQLRRESTGRSLPTPTPRKVGQLDDFGIGHIIYNFQNWGTNKSHYWVNV